MDEITQRRNSEFSLHHISQRFRTFFRTVRFVDSEKNGIGAKGIQNFTEQKNTRGFSAWNRLTNDHGS